MDSRYTLGQGIQIETGKMFIKLNYVRCLISNHFDRNLVEKFGAFLVKVDEALKHSNLVVLAIPKDFYKKLDTHLFEGKTIIDVSNRSSVQRKEETSQAEHLQALLPKTSIVKAFNVLSAYALESGGIQGNLRKIHTLQFCSLPLQV